MRYRSEIDGLRAIAVLSVIFYHAGFTLFAREWFAGGYIGVDVFFVISGYLISKLVFTELVQTNAFSFLGFYQRRARRILPMLLVVGLVSFPFAYFLLLPEPLIEFAQSVLSALAFISNYFFYTATLNYGDESSLLKPFLHTWSLSVEEQFYLVFPCIALLLHRYFRRGQSLVFSGIVLISFALSVYLVKEHSEFNFFFSGSRAWELLTGSLLAAYELKVGPAKPGRVACVFATVGLILVCYAVSRFSKDSAHPGWITLLPVVGSVLLLRFAVPGTQVATFLSTKLMVGVGLISYSLYLWHFPIFAFLRIKFYQPSLLVWCFAIAVTFVLSYLSYVYIEQPCRSRNKSEKSVLTWLLLGVAVLASASAALIMAKGAPARFEWLAASADDMKYYRKDYWSDRSRFIGQDEFSDSKVSIVVIGNSWGTDIATSLSLNDRFEVYYQGMTGHMCTEFTVSLLGAGNKDSEHWRKRCESNSDRFRAISKDADVLVLSDHIVDLHQYDIDDVRGAFEQNIALIRKHFDGPVVVVKSRPTWQKGAFQMASDYGSLADGLNPYATQKLAVSYEVLQMADEYYAGFYARYGVHYISLFPKLCDTGICRVTDQSKLLYFDQWHLTLDGARYVSGYLSDNIIEAISAQKHHGQPQ